MACLFSWYDLWRYYLAMQTARVMSYVCDAFGE